MASTFLERTAKAITLDNALRWEETPEKWMFVTDLIAGCDIDYDPHGNNIDRMVRSVEHRLDKLLKESRSGRT